MSSELLPVDISQLPDLLRLAEEVKRSGTARALLNGDETVAVLAPPIPARSARRSPRGRRTPDAILRLKGLGASAEPTDIARHKHAYLAHAYDQTSP